MQTLLLVKEEQFLRMCNTGDILLFETDHPAAKMIRTFTSSAYDHVGIIYRDFQNNVYVFDSNADTGVTLLDWDEFIF